MTQRHRLRLIPLMVTGCLLAMGSPAGRAVTTPSWQVYTTISPNNQEVQLNAITASAPGDAWAVGDLTTAGDLIEHWDGTSWQRVQVPSRLLREVSPLTGVVAVSSSDVWVFGALGHWLHFSGSVWTTGKLPALPGGAHLELIVNYALVTGHRLWAFGFNNIRTGGLIPYAAHFDGTRWHASAVPGPRGGGSNGIFDASALGTGNIWAVISGSTFPSLRSPNALRHWNGSSWSKVALPASLVSAAVLDSVLALPDGQVWVGGYIPGGSTAAAAVVAVWNGHGWKVSDLPAVPHSHDVYLQQLSSDGAGGIWALGLIGASSGAGPLWHYTSGTWTAPAFVPGTIGAYLHGPQGMALIPGTTSLWAAGGEYSARSVNNEMGIILRYG